MAEQKIFAGPRIRRVRMQRGLTQSAMAQGLGISPSYLNLIERNQRPLTVQLILKLASAYKVDPEELQAESGGPVSALKEVFADPLLAGELPGDQELIEIAEGAPNVSGGIVKLYRAYREQADRLSDLNALLIREGRATALAIARLPIDEVREALELRPNVFPALEALTETFLGSLGGERDLQSAVSGWLRQELGITVRVLPAATMPNWRRRYDRHSQRLFVSERLSPPDRLREIASEACLIHMKVAIAEEVARLPLSSDEARRLARFELGRYAAHALMMPYRPFLEAATRLRYDIAALTSRFGVSFEQAATRLTTLQLAEAQGVPFFLIEIDHAGHRLRRAGAQGYPQTRFGGGCPKLAVHAAFAQPGQALAEAVVMPDGATFLTMARTVDGPQGAFNERPRRTALLLGCDIAHREQVVYGDALLSSGKAGAPAAMPIGPACRLCERSGCLSRAEPPVTRPLGLDEVASGMSVFDFQ